MVVTVSVSWYSTGRQEIYMWGLSKVKVKVRAVTSVQLPVPTLGLPHLWHKSRR